MARTVVIDCFPESATRYKDRFATIVVDVFRFTTTAATALALGRRVFPVASTDEAAVCGARLVRPLYAGELGGHKPYGWDLQNSPSVLAERDDTDRPVVLLSSSGARLLRRCRGGHAVYAACFRNITATVAHVADRHDEVAVLGAGTRGVFRREDRMACARIAALLVERGYVPGSGLTRECLESHADARLELASEGRSGDYLRRSGQARDIEFVLAHVDDLDLVPQLVGDELVEATP